MIYYLEDDPHILDLAIYTLQTAGLDARGFSCAHEFFAACEDELPDVALLDIMLPDMDGMEVLKRLRREHRTKNLPVMMLTAKGSEIDKVMGLDAGADDYLAKPFGMMELIARVNALMRRARAASPTTEDVTCGPLSISEATRKATVNGKSVALTRKEFDLLYALMSNAGCVLTRTQLLENVWGVSFLGESRTVDAHILTLRQKLDATMQGAGRLIETVRGVGYRMQQ